MLLGALLAFPLDIRVSVLRGWPEAFYPQIATVVDPIETAMSAGKQEVDLHTHLSRLGEVCFNQCAS